MYNKSAIKMNLSFAGCGFLGIYHVGVACCFRKYAPHLLLNEISGASIGAIAACSLLCDIPLGECGAGPGGGDRSFVYLQNTDGSSR